MSSYNDTGYGTIKLTATVAQHRRVKADGTVAGDEADVGTVTEGGVSGDPVTLSYKNKQGTTFMVANGALAVGDDATSAADGKVGAGGAVTLGTVMSEATADGDVIEVLRT